MSGIAKVLLFMVNCVLTNNFIFSRYLGNCPFLGVSNKVETATGMGLAVTFVMGLASLFTYLIYTYILVPLGLSYLSTIVFILVIASLVQIVEMFIKKSSPSLYKALGIYLPLITTNCAVLGVCLLNIGSPITIGGEVLEFNLLYSSTAYSARWASCWPLCLWRALGKGLKLPKFRIALKASPAH